MGLVTSSGGFAVAPPGRDASPKADSEGAARASKGFAFTAAQDAGVSKDSVFRGTPKCPPPPIHSRTWNPTRGATHHLC